jgi:2,3-dihydroxybiphenyl 1,2-dioxygenase
MVSVTELGYVGIGIQDEAAWIDYATRIVGLELRDDGEADRFYLRTDNWHHRIVVHRNAGDDLLYVGWRVVDRTALEEMAELLTRNGIEFRFGTAEEEFERRVLGLVKLVDPGGNPTEIFYGPLVDMKRPFHPGRPMHGRFVNGSQGLGHCILRQADSEAAYKFYRLLGMSGGVDYKRLRPNGHVSKLTFMRCNERQHSVAFGVAHSEKRINHLMIEYTDLADLGVAHDLIREANIPVAVGLGVHSNDRALTFYAANPSGWLWEIGTKGEESPGKQEYYTDDVFGHKKEADGYGF